MSPEFEKVLCSAPGPDPCDTDTLMKAVYEAKASVGRSIIPSPLHHSQWLSELTGGNIWLKLECLNPNGSFKVRGALNAISKRLQEHDKQNPGTVMKVCAASAGNHAQGVAFAARKMGCEAHIFLPKRTPMVKRAATERLGAKVYLEGDVLEEAFEAALAFAKSTGAQFLHAFNDFDIIMGQSTCALEILDAFAAGEAGALRPNDIDDFICSIGGGGLAAGSGIVFKTLSRARVLGVEQENFDSAVQSLQAGVQTGVSRPGLTTIADGISVRRIGNLTFGYLQKYLDRGLLVSDDDIVAAVLGLCEREHVVSEGAGAAAVAAILKNPGLFKGRTVVACVSGGNIDPQLLSRVITRGLGVTGRVLRLTARIGDRPGQLKNLLDEIASVDANVIEVYHDRTYTKVNVGDVEVDLALETKDSGHQYELVQRLEEKGFEPKVRNN